jgi:hypothetical protein
VARLFPESEITRMVLFGKARRRGGRVRTNGFGDDQADEAQSKRQKKADPGGRPQCLLRLAGFRVRPSPWWSAASVANRMRKGKERIAYDS